MTPRLVFRWVATSPILLYQKIISPILPNSCIYEPSCSSYARAAVLRHGVLKGLALGIARVSRCAPGFFTGGPDPVPEDFSRGAIAEGYRGFRRRGQGSARRRRSMRSRLRGRRNRE